MIAAVYSLLVLVQVWKGRGRLTMNRLLQHSAIVLFILCLAVGAFLLSWSRRRLNNRMLRSSITSEALRC